MSLLHARYSLSLTFLYPRQHNPCHAQVAVGLAAWVAGTGASSVRLQRLLPNTEPRENCGRQVGVNSADESLNETVKVDFEDMGELAVVLAAPCSRRGLECRLERSVDGDAIIMRRQP